MKLRLTLDGVGGTVVIDAATVEKVRDVTEFIKSDGTVFLSMPSHSIRAIDALEPRKPPEALDVVKPAYPSQERDSESVAWALALLAVLALFALVLGWLIVRGSGH
ncbi:MAG: hypothetical protein OXF27_00230 [Acidobacteria bacterium]|nr:hypothetical protein [Acidobacteriota bacterium]